jgi:hypothetical protein
VRLVSPIGGATGGSGNLFGSSSNVARLAAHPKFVWVFNANCEGTIINTDLVRLIIERQSKKLLELFLIDPNLISWKILFKLRNRIIVFSIWL